MGSIAKSQTTKKKKPATKSVPKVAPVSEWEPFKTKLLKLAEEASANAAKGGADDSRWARASHQLLLAAQG